MCRRRRRNRARPAVIAGAGAHARRTIECAVERRRCTPARAGFPGRACRHRVRRRDRAGMNEDDVANFILSNPEFFRRKPWLLGSIELPDPHDGRAISLAERQTQILRERIRALEANLADLARNGRDNDALGEGLALWSATLLAERNEE